MKLVNWEIDQMETVQTIQETEDEIVDEFSLFDSWEDKYEYIIDLGKKIKALEPEFVWQIVLQWEHRFDHHMGHH